MIDREFETATTLFKLVDAIDNMNIQERGKLFENEAVDSAYCKAKVQLKKYRAEIRGQITEAISKAGINQRFNNITIHE